MSDEEDRLRVLFADLAQRQPARGTDGAFITKRLRQRRARQGVATACLAVLAVVGVGTGVLLPGGSGRPAVTTKPADSLVPSLEPSPTPSVTGPAPVPPPLTATTGLQLVVVQGTRLELLDVDSGRRTPLPTDPRLAGNERLDVLAVGDQLVMLANNNTGAGNGPSEALATTAGPGSPMSAIGQASYLLASEHDGRVWLVTDNDTNEDAGTTLTEVDLRGGVTQRATFPQSFNVQPFAGGFLRATLLPDGSDGQDTELVTAAGRRLHLYPGRVVAAGRDAVVLSEGEPCTADCTLRRLTRAQPVHESTATFDYLGSFVEAAVAPDGSSLFTNQAISDAGAQPGRITQFALGTGDRGMITDAWTAPYWGPSIRLSSDGRWMFFADANGKTIDAHDLTTGRSYRVPGTFRTITQLELLP